MNPEDWRDSLPGISVAMATHNGMRFLQAQLHSILVQLEPDDEVVIVDDASNDGTWEFLSAQQDPRIRAFRQDENRGVIRTFEHALGMTSRPIVFLADQDDVWMPSKRSAYVEAFTADPLCVAVIADASVINMTGDEICDSWMRSRGGFAGGWLQTLLRSRWLGCAMAIRHELLDNALPFPVCAPMHDMWLGVVSANIGVVKYLDQPLLKYRRHNNNATPTVRVSLRNSLFHRLQLLCCLFLVMARPLANRHSKSRPSICI